MKITSLCGAVTLLLLILTSCKKDVSGSGSTNSSTIAVAASESTAASGVTSDSVYLVQPCNRNETRNAVAATDLPAAVTTYLSANYSGYTFAKAFSVTNSSTSTIDAYVVVIFYNDKPVGLLFDSSGNFVKVLEQREKRDIDGRGWHDGGGRFCDRDGRGRDSIALSSLSASILSYMATNYPQDSLVKAFQNRHDSSIAVISKNNGLFATIFDANGNFKARINLPAPPGHCVSIAQTDLPSNVQSYLSTTYPNYVFEKAFAAYNSSNVLQGYVVVINANNTKYAVKFDAPGNFVSVRTIW